MKTGIEYANSRQKRAFDLALATAMIPASIAAEKVAAFSLKHAGLHDVTPVLMQKRAGRHGEPFDIYKIRTLDPRTDEPYSKLGGLLRKLGVDEFAQARNIFKGEMSFNGWRPLIGEEREETFDNLTPANQRLRLIVESQSNPGNNSTWGQYAHQHPGYKIAETANARTEMDYKDLIDGSLVYEVGLIKSFVQLAIERRLR